MNTKQLSDSGFTFNTTTTTKSSFIRPFTYKRYGDRRLTAPNQLHEQSCDAKTNNFGHTLPTSCLYATTMMLEMRETFGTECMNIYPLLIRFVDMLPRCRKQKVRVRIGKRKIYTIEWQGHSLEFGTLCLASNVSKLSLCLDVNVNKKERQFVSRKQVYQVFLTMSAKFEVTP